MTALTSRAGNSQDDQQTGQLVSYTLGQNERNRSQGPANYIAHALTSEGHDASEDGTGRGTPIIAFQSRWRGDDGRGYDREPAVSEEQTHALDGQTREFIAGSVGGGNDGIGRRSEDDPNLMAYTLGQNDRNRSQGPANYAVGSSVRRLTPVECCRLQGFPDDWLGEPNEPPDSPRYAALGDAVTVPVAEWIGRRLMEAV